MRTLFFILALTGMFSYNFRNVIIVAAFEMNRDYITQNLCVKRSEKNNTCQGKCHLRKKIAEEEKKDTSGPARELKEGKEISLYYSATALTALKKETSSSETSYQPYLLFIPAVAAAGIFHPPRC